MSIIFNHLKNDDFNMEDKKETLFIKESKYSISNPIVYLVECFDEDEIYYKTEERLYKIKDKIKDGSIIIFYHDREYETTDIEIFVKQDGKFINKYTHDLPLTDEERIAKIRKEELKEIAEQKKQTVEKIGDLQKELRLLKEKEKMMSQFDLSGRRIKPKIKITDCSGEPLRDTINGEIITSH